MTVLPIKLIGDPVLRTPAAPVTDFDAELRKLVDDLAETLAESHGAGLAAPQLGVSLRVFALAPQLSDGQFDHLINPVLEFPDEEDQDARHAHTQNDGYGNALRRRAPSQRRAEHGQRLTQRNIDASKADAEVHRRQQRRRQKQIL